MPLTTPPVVHVHHPFDVLELADLDVAAEGDAGVVVDLVDLAEVALDPTRRRRAGEDSRSATSRRSVLTLTPIAFSRASVTARPSVSTSLMATEAFPARPS